MQGGEASTVTPERFAPALASRGLYFIRISYRDDAQVKVIFTGVVADQNDFVIPRFDETLITGTESHVVGRDLAGGVFTSAQLFAEADEDIHGDWCGAESVMELVDAPLREMEQWRLDCGALVDGARGVGGATFVDHRSLPVDATVGAA